MSFAQHGEAGDAGMDFPVIPLWALWLRLPIQLALLALIAWSTKPG
jgi:uncharacterized membrane protein